RALESLDPSDNTPRYFRWAKTAAGKDEQHTETEKWLDLGEELDDSARILIRYCLARAAENAIDKSKEWVQLAEALDTEEETDLRIVRIISDENELLNSPSLDESTRKQVEDRIRRLDTFLKMANVLSSDLRAKLEQLNNTDATF